MNLVPHIAVSDAAAFIEFCKQAFGAQELNRHQMPDSNKIMHAAVQIGDTMLMLNDEFPEMGALSAKSIGGNPVVLNVNVDNADAAWKQALDAGATVHFPLADQFWGDRYGQVKDPFGNVWAIAQTVERLTPEEMQARAAQAMKG